MNLRTIRPVRLIMLLIDDNNDDDDHSNNNFIHNNNIIMYRNNNSMLNKHVIVDITLPLVPPFLLNDHLKIYCASYTAVSLPIRQRIHYKIATITYRALHLQQPSYISSLLVNYIPPRSLPFTSQGLLNAPG